jgi:Ca2+:H+ antiporter
MATLAEPAIGKHKMAPEQKIKERMPWWAWSVPLGAWLLLAAKFSDAVPADARAVLLAAALFLAGTVFAAVHHAEVVALRVGEPFGSIVLAVAVTVIEVALIVSIMISGSNGSEAVARDTVFAAVMIVLNGVVGLCLVAGGTRHYEQTFQVQGAAAALGVLGTLAIFALVLPNYTRTVPGPFYAQEQMLFIGAVSLCLYGLFLFVQTVRHRDYFLVAEGPDAGYEHHAKPPSAKAALMSVFLMCVALIAVVLLAKTLSPSIERAVVGAGLQTAFVGVIIAALVLLPEGIAALGAARANRLQTSLNLALGSALATIGMTIPAVAVVSVLLGQRLVMGLPEEEMVLLVLTLFTSTLTLATGRTTVLQGAIHIVIFSVFILLSIRP